MKPEILYRHANAAARVTMGPSETVICEGGAMIAMSPDMSVTTTTQQKGGGGIMAGLKRMLTGEKFFLNHFKAGPQGGELWLSTTLPGDMLAMNVGQGKIIVQAGSFVACEPSIHVGFGWQGFKTLFSGESLFWIEISGAGQLIINSFGAIYPVEVDGEYIVDTGHIVAFNEELNFEITKAGSSWIASFLGGEGLVCKFKGKGTVWCQSHNEGAFGSALGSECKARR